MRSSGHYSNPREGLEIVLGAPSERARSGEHRDQRLVEKVLKILDSKVRALAFVPSERQDDGPLVGESKAPREALPEIGAAMTTDSSANKTPSTGQRRSRVNRIGRRWIYPVQLSPPLNPALLKHAEERAEKGQNRLADRITAFAGSMAFVYVHVLWFACWIGFGVEQYPFGLLTMIVSLEAIFLSTFVLISQNRAEAKRQVLADHQWSTVQEEDRQNKELLKLSNQQDRQNKELLDLSNKILTLTKDVRSVAERARENSELNKEQLDISRRTLALTEAVHAHAGGAGSGDSGSRSG